MSALSRGGEWAACAALVRHALHLYTSENGSRATWVFGGLGSIFAILAYTGSGRTLVSFMMVAGLFVSLQVLASWMVLFNSLVQQNAGTGALVPGIGRRSILVLALAFCVAVVCVTAPFAIAGLPVALVCLFVAIVLIFAALIVVRPMVAMVAVAAVVTPTLTNRYGMALGQDVVLGFPLLVSVVAASLAVRALIQGKSRSVFARARVTYDVEHQVRRATAGYARTLKRDSERRDIPALVLHCLGPVAAQQTVMTALMLPLIVGVAFALSITAPSLVGQYRAAGHASVGVPLAIVSVLLTQLYMVITAIRRTTAEQTLVMLAARRPEAGALNQLLARTLVVRYGYVWVMLSAMLLVVSAIFGAGVGELVWLLAILLVTLTAGSLLLQDYAKADQGKPVLPILLGVCALGTLFAAALTRISVAAGAVFVALWLALALLCFALRWKAMLRAPVAFPARRLT